MISVYGAGYVGLVSAACFAKLGHQVICYDINVNKVNELTAGKCPIFEDNLPELLTDVIESGHLSFTTNIKVAVANSEVHILAVGTPSLNTGEADLSQIFAVTKEIVACMQKSGVIVVKSTVPVGTGDKLEMLVQEELANLNKLIVLEVASNPEFLREGTAVLDFLKADRIVIGGNKNALTALEKLYIPLTSQGIPLISMSRTSAELTKYAANTMLACRISFINQMSRLAEISGANIDEISQGIGSDHRIGRHFLQAGIGYGGSCFPKDGRALVQIAKQMGESAALLEAIEQINERQKSWVIEKLNAHFNYELQNLTIGIWGLAFKPGTDDMREASSLIIIHHLLKAGTSIRVYDPVAMNSARLGLSDIPSITWCESREEVLNSIDALIIATEWEEFKQFPLPLLAETLQAAPLIDGRNCFSLEAVKNVNLTYYSVGRPLLQRLDN